MDYVLIEGKLIQIMDSQLNEALLTVKRKYTESHPAHINSSHGPTRNPILEFINSKGTVTHTQLKEFIQMKNESAGTSTGFSWVKRNEHLINKMTREGQEPTYSLTSRGRRLMEKIKTLDECDKKPTLGKRK